MMGRVWMEKGDYAKAVESLLRVIDQDKELVSETLEMLQTCYQQLGKAMSGKHFLRRCVEENTGATAELMLAQILEQGRGAKRRKTTLPVSWSVIRPCASSIS
jgi:lipopolysaccharide biosynthesis regulator YciM